MERKSDKDWTRDTVEALQIPDSKKKKIYSYLSQFPDGTGDSHMDEQTPESNEESEERDEN